jgi:hypothetical protein
VLLSASELNKNLPSAAAVSSEDELLLEELPEERSRGAELAAKRRGALEAGRTEEAC